MMTYNGVVRAGHLLVIFLGMVELYLKLMDHSLQVLRRLNQLLMLENLDCGCFEWTRYVCGY